MKIALSLAAALLFIGCSQDTKQETKEAETKQVQAKKEVVVTEVKKDLEVAPKAQTQTETEVIAPVVESPVVEVVEETVAQVKSVVPVTQIKTEVAKVATEAKTKVEEIANEVTAVAETPVEKPAVDAKVMFKVCSSCHGANGQNVALGKSKIIKGWSSAKVTEALNGYKNGTYGGVMKGTMKAQVANLSEADIKALSDYISKL